MRQKLSDKIVPVNKELLSNGNYTDDANCVMEYLIKPHYHEVQRNLRALGNALQEEV